MNERIRALWAERSLREQRMLLVMFALLAIVIIWFLVLRPLTDAKAAARARLDRATVEAGQIAAAVETLSDARRSAPAAVTGTLTLAVSQSAEAAGFTLASFDPQGDDRLAITIGSAKSPALFAWLRTLSGQGIFVERMTLRTSSDATLAVDATLGRRK